MRLVYSFAHFDFIYCRNKRQVNKEWVNGLLDEADAAERELVAETVVKKMREMANRPVRWG